jgi:predicted phage terminase large subunit-like protein
MNFHAIRDARASQLLAELNLRIVRADQSKRGEYDANGIRQGGLVAFVRYFWHILEPSTPYVDGWPIWAIIEHLEAVTFGDINRLLINVPPGFSKSLLTDVFWPAWEWGPMRRPDYRYLAFSYSAHLTERDNRKFRALIASREYQDLYGDVVQLENKTSHHVRNVQTGWKLASSVNGVGTGERGDRVICDDLHNVVDAESEQVRTETVRWFREAVSDRFNSLDRGALIIIMQRVHEGDVAGSVLELGLPYCHLMIPMEYDPVRQETLDGAPKQTDIGWSDPRTEDGESAWPVRFSPQAIERLKLEKGPYAWASQYQQAPAPRGGGIFERAWWQLWESADGKFPELDYIVASVDGAFTEKEENDPSAMTVWGVFNQSLSIEEATMFTDPDTGQIVARHTPLATRQRRIILLGAWRKHLKFSGPRIPRKPLESDVAYRQRTRESWGLVETIADTCNRFKVDTLLIEGKASGISAAQELQNRYGLQRWAINVQPVKGDKIARALAAQPTFSQLMVYAPDKDWADMVIDEMATFPKAKYDDLTDSATQAINYLRGIGLAQTDDEAAVSEYEGLKVHRKLKALYPV